MKRVAFVAAVFAIAACADAKKPENAPAASASAASAAVSADSSMKMMDSTKKMMDSTKKMVDSTAGTKKKP